MKVTGYAIREALRRWQLRRDTAESQFVGSLMRFEGDQKSTPEEIVRITLEAETAIARLQTLQTRYNLNVQVTVDGFGRISLLECIKRFGGLGRVEKLWRKAATEKEDRYGLIDRNVRDKDQVVATRSISFEEASKRTIEAGKQLGALREAVAVGNARDVDFEDLDAALFE